MKNIRLVVGLSFLGLVVAVACGDDSKSGSNPADAGEGGSGGSTGGKTTSGGKSGSSNAAGSGDVPMGGTQTGEAGSGMGQAGADPGPGCGNGPACDENTQVCVGGNCLLVDGEACTANAECEHTCIGEVCSPRADMLEECDFAGGGAGGAGGQGNTPGVGGGGGEGGETIYVPPEEMGNGDDADCLDGLGCGDGLCKRKQGTDCTGVEQCLSGICHKSKCTPEYAGTCTANVCVAMDPCGTTTTSANNCSFNYLPNSSCTQFKTACFESCTCNLAP